MTHIDVEEVLCPLGEKLLVRVAQRQGFEDVACAVVALEHGVVNRVSKICRTLSALRPYTPGVLSHTESLPIDSDQLRPRRPIPMRLIVRRADASTLRVHPYDMRPIVLDQIHHALLEQLFRRVLR